MTYLYVSLVVLAIVGALGWVCFGRGRDYVIKENLEKNNERLKNDAKIDAEADADKQSIADWLYGKSK